MRRLGALLLAASLAACGGDARETGPYVVTLDLGPTIRALADDGTTLDRDAAVERLAGFGPAALPAVDAALGREDAAVRTALVEVLATMDAPAATTRLAAVATGDPDDDVRAQAVVALGGMDAADAVAAVARALLDDRSPNVQRTAAAACGARCTAPNALARRVALALAPPPGPDTLRITGALGQVLHGADADAAARLRALLRERAVPLLRADTPIQARTAAAFLAVDVDHAAALAALAAATADAELTATVRAVALETLGRVGGEESVPAVQAAVGDPTLRLAALGALHALQGRGVDAAPASDRAGAPVPGTP